jgi:hypothetical protein
VSYLLVDEADGAVVAEFEQFEDAVRAWEAEQEEEPRKLRLVVFHEGGGELASSESWITVASAGFRAI